MNKPHRQSPASTQPNKRIITRETRERKREGNREYRFVLSEFAELDHFVRSDSLGVSSVSDYFDCSVASRTRLCDSRVFVSDAHAKRCLIESYAHDGLMRVSLDGDATIFARERTK